MDEEVEYSVVVENVRLLVACKDLELPTVQSVHTCAEDSDAGSSYAENFDVRDSGVDDDGDGGDFQALMVVWPSHHLVVVFYDEKDEQIY